MKPTRKQKRNNLIASFIVVIAGVLALMAVSAWNDPMRTLKRGLRQDGFTVRSERNADAGEYAHLSAETAALRIGGDRVLIFGFRTFDDAAAAENDFWAAYGEEYPAGTYLVDRYLLLYTGEDAGLQAALEEKTF
ncbi:MAG: hypothetical protein IKM31_05545 [Oscillospiraceae bacterium]|nr:hypothetical protein [Oscillospiraceae bacterium]